MRWHPIAPCALVLNLEIPKTFNFMLALAFSGFALAGEACDKSRNNFDGMYCINKIYLEADRELPQWPYLRVGICLN